MAIRDRVKSLRRTAGAMARSLLTRPDLTIRPAEAPPLGSRPTFLLGPFRSGTTLARFALDSHSALAVPPESEFLGVLQGLLDDERAARGLASMGFDEDHVVQRLRAFSAYFFEGYAEARGASRWIDKSPIYLEHLDFLDRLFPDAQYLTLHRHGLSQAWSVTNGGESLDFHPVLADAAEPGDPPLVAASRYWASRTTRLLDFEQAHPDRCHRMTYEGLCADPQGVLEGALAFLGEPWEPGVLDFAAHPHDRGMEDDRARRSKGFQPSVDHGSKWPADQREQAMAWVGPVLERVDPERYGSR